jgi:hypothetical protein
MATAASQAIVNAMPPEVATFEPAFLHQSIKGLDLG